MKLAEGIEVLSIHTNQMGNEMIMHPVVIYDENNVALVDTAVPGMLPQIRNEMRKANIPFENLNKVIITHQDIDHIGGIKGILQALPNRVQVLAHEIEKPYINGEKKPHKLAQLEAKLEVLPENMKEIYGKLKVGFEHSHAEVDVTLKDGEVLPYGGGITVVFTPGHTLGHICLYHKASKTLIAGDALGVEDGKLITLSKSAIFDADLNKKSLQKLTEYDIDTVICYHGGVYRENVNKSIADLAREALY